MASWVNSTNYEKFNTNPSQTFQKLEKETLPNLFYEADITLILKPYKDILRILETNNPYEYRHKILNKKLTKQI